MHVFDPETGELLVEQIMAVIGPRALVKDAQVSGWGVYSYDFLVLPTTSYDFL